MHFHNLQKKDKIPSPKNNIRNIYNEIMTNKKIDHYKLFLNSNLNLIIEIVLIIFIILGIIFVLLLYRNMKINKK